MASGTYYPAAAEDVGYWSANGTEFIPGGWLGSVVGFGSHPTGGYSNHTWVRFNNVAVPKGSVINSAVSKFVAYSTQSATVCNVNVYTLQADDAANPTTISEANAFSLSDPVAWSAVETFNDGTTYSTPDIASLIQAVIDREDWEIGNHIMVVVKDNGSTAGAKREASTYTYNSGTEKPSLELDWTAPQLLLPPAAELTITGHPASIVTEFSRVYEWEGDTTQARGDFTWKSKLILLAAMTNFTAARVEADFSADQEAYFAAVAERQAIIARNAALISSGLPTALVSGAPIGTLALGGDVLETVPTVAAYAGGATLKLKVYADGVLKQTVDVFSSQPFRLLGGYRSKQYAFQLEGNIAVKKLEIATSIGDLVEA